MRGHERRDVCAHSPPEGQDLPAENGPAGAAYNGQLFVGIRVGVAVAGEMFSHGNYPSVHGTALERNPEARDSFRVASQRPVSDHRVFRVAVDVQHGREVDVYPDGGKFKRDRRARRFRSPLRVTAEEGVAPRGRELREPGILKPCDPAAFLVDRDQRCGTTFAGRRPDLPAQFLDLLRPFQVA